MSDFLFVMGCLAVYGLGAGMTGGIMYFFHALKNEECTFHEFFFGDTPAPFLGSLFWPVGLPFAVSIHGFALLASGAAKMIRRRAKLCEHEDKLRSLELIQAEKEVEKLLNG